MIQGVEMGEKVVLDSCGQYRSPSAERDPVCGNRFIGTSDKKGGFQNVAY